MNNNEALDWIAGVFEMPAGRLSPDTARHEVPTWDSLGTLTLIAALDELNIQVDEQELEAMAKIDDVFAVLRRHGALAEA